MSLRIIKNGLLDTIQDEGRYGYQHLGINPGGAMDNISMRVANMLVGNDPCEAVIEMHFPAAEIFFEQSALIALSGADFSAMINTHPVALNKPLMVQEGSVLRFTKNISGCRVYFSIQGGFVADEWLASCSTHLKVKAGGFAGRALQRYDRILLKQNMAHTFVNEEEAFRILPWQANTTDLYTMGNFHFIQGAEYAYLDEPSKAHLEAGVFIISKQSDRMGYRLEGPVIQLTTPMELISTAVTKGTIQLLPDGQLIVLMADHQTTGGYPRVAHVISADIPSLSQTGVGQKIVFTQTHSSTAENMLLQQQRNLQQLQNACTFRLQEYFNQ